MLTEAPAQSPNRQPPARPGTCSPWHLFSVHPTTLSPCKWSTLHLLTHSDVPSIALSLQRSLAPAPACHGARSPQHLLSIAPAVPPYLVSKFSGAHSGTQSGTHFGTHSRPCFEKRSTTASVLIPALALAPACPNTHSPWSLLSRSPLLLVPARPGADPPGCRSPKKRAFRSARFLTVPEVVTKRPTPTFEDTFNIITSHFRKGGVSLNYRHLCPCHA
jgi:hypothetical protein